MRSPSESEGAEHFAARVVLGKQRSPQTSGLVCLLLRSNLSLRRASDSPQGLLLLSLQALHEHFLGPLRSFLVVIQDRAKEIY